MLTIQPITQSELETYLWGAATRLRGTIDAGDYKQFIFPLLFWKRLCDVYDEETQHAVDEYGEAFPENHRFQIPDGAHWKEVRQQATNVGMSIQEAMHTIETANAELAGIFGDAPWTNKERLPDGTLRDLMEHFSSQTLSMARVTEDLLGQAYEYLIKKFADDSGHTAAEFYTNRTVVHLMTLMLEPQPGESVYDPTCGSGGMLISAVEELRRQGKEYRNLKLYGQEVNLMTSAMAQMNLFMHGFESFHIRRGDTLANPLFLERDRLQQFDVVLANPPYSVKQWNRKLWENDPYGRNHYGTPPQGRADYAFFQHIITSLKPKTGRCAILFPHGVLFRDEERHMREKIVQADLIECVIGLGPNLFYNSPMEACVVICRMNKPAERRGKILFTNAVNEVTRERAFSFLEEDHIHRIANVYRTFEDVEGFARVVDVGEVLGNHATLNIPLYVRPQNGNGEQDKSLEAVVAEWQESSEMLRVSMDDLFSNMESLTIHDSVAQLPPEIVISGMKGLAVQVYDFSKLFQSVQPKLDDVLDVYASQMRDLQLIANPMPGLLDSINAALPKLDIGAIVGIDRIQASVSRSLAAVIESTIDISAFAATLGRIAFSQQAMLDEIAKTTSLLTSETFRTIQASLKLQVSVEGTIKSFLDSLTANYGLGLKGVVGDYRAVDITVGVLSDDLPIEGLPPEIQSNVGEVRRYVYEHGITVTALLLWAVNCLWILHDKSIESASSLVNTLLTLLIVLKEMAENDEK